MAGTIESSFRDALRSVFSARKSSGLGPFYYLLFRLYRSSAAEWNNYILSSEANRITRNINGNEKTVLVGNKALFHRHCEANKIRTAPVYGMIGDVNVNVGKPVMTPLELERALPSPPSELFFKIVDGSHGEGAFVVKRCEDSQWEKGGRIYDTSELLQFIQNNSANRSAYLVQPALKPHKELMPIMPNESLGTVRVVTYLNKGEAKAIFPVLRIPSRDNITDNFSSGLSGNLVAPINITTGELGFARISTSRKYPEIKDISKHPDTGSIILKRKVPLWHETLQLVLDAQTKTHELPTLGWDVAITDDGPMIVEANAAYCVELLQVAYDRGLRTEFKSLFLNCSSR